MYFLNRKGACYSITRIIFNVYIWLIDINITKNNKQDEKQNIKGSFILGACLFNKEEGNLVFGTYF